MLFSVIILYFSERLGNDPITHNETRKMNSIECNKTFGLAQKVDLILDYLVEALTVNQYVKAIDITYMKMMLNDKKVSDLYNEFFVCESLSNFRYIQKKLLDANFNRKLDQMISEAKNS